LIKTNHQPSAHRIASLLFICTFLCSLAALSASAPVYLGLSKIQKTVDGLYTSSVIASATQPVYPGAKVEFLVPGNSPGIPGDKYVLEVSDAYYSLLETDPVYCGDPTYSVRTRCDCPGSLASIGGEIWKTPWTVVKPFVNPNVTVRGNCRADGCFLSGGAASYLAAIEIQPSRDYRVTAIRGLNTNIYLSFYKDGATNRTGVFWDGVSQVTLPPVSGLTVTVAGATRSDPSKYVRLVGANIVQDVSQPSDVRVLSTDVISNVKPDARKFCWNRVVNDVHLFDSEGVDDMITTIVMKCAPTSVRISSTALVHKSLFKTLPSLESENGGSASADTDYAPVDDQPSDW
jgi:hypothetical protein